MAAPGTAGARGPAPPWRVPEGPALDLDEWNAPSGKRGNCLLNDIRRLTGDKVQYFKGTEFQRRGAIHFHILLKREDGLPTALSKGQLRQLALKYGFGHSVDMQPVTAGHAAYAAKYASRAADDRPDVPWRGQARYERVNKTTGEVTEGTQLVYRARYRTWTASRCWSHSMQQVRAAQGHHEAVVERLPRWDRPCPIGYVWDAINAAPLRPPGG